MTMHSPKYKKKNSVESVQSPHLKGSIQDI